MPSLLRFCSPWAKWNEPEPPTKPRQTIYRKPYRSKEQREAEEAVKQAAAWSLSVQIASPTAGSIPSSVLTSTTEQTRTRGFAQRPDPPSPQAFHPNIEMSTSSTSQINNEVLINDQLVRQTDGLAPTLMPEPGEHMSLPESAGLLGSPEPPEAPESSELLEQSEPPPKASEPPPKASEPLSPPEPPAPPEPLEPPEPLDSSSALIATNFLDPLHAPELAKLPMESHPPEPPGAPEDEWMSTLAISYWMQQRCSRSYKAWLQSTKHEQHMSSLRRKAVSVMTNARLAQGWNAWMAHWNSQLAIEFARCTARHTERRWKHNHLSFGFRAWMNYSQSRRFQVSCLERSVRHSTHACLSVAWHALQASSQHAVTHKHWASHRLRRGHQRWSSRAGNRGVNVAMLRRAKGHWMHGQLSRSWNIWRVERNKSGATQQAVSRVMRRMISLPLCCAWNTWRMYRNIQWRHNGVLLYASRYWQEHQIARCWQSWRRRFEATLIIELAMANAARHWRQHRVAWSWWSWVSFATCNQARAIAPTRWTRRHLLIGWNTWSGHRAKLFEVRSLLARAVCHSTICNLCRGWRTWCLLLRIWWKDRGLLLYSLGHWQKRCLARSWAEWRGTMLEWRAHIRWRHNNTSRCWNTWRLRSTQIIMMERMMTEAVHNVGTHGLRLSWRVWCAQHHQQWRQRGVLLYAAAHCRDLSLAQAWRKWLQVTIEGWRTASLVVRHKHRRHRRAWKRWHSFVNIRHSLNRVAPLLMHCGLSIGWATWNDFARGRRAYVRSVSHAVSHMLKRDLSRSWSSWRDTLQYDRALAHWMARDVSRCWSTWQQHNAVVVCARTRLKHAMQHMTNSALSRGWLAWRAQWQCHCRLNSLMTLSVSHLLQRDLSCAWVTWVERLLRDRAVAHWMDHGISRSWIKWNQCCWEVEASRRRVAHAGWLERHRRMCRGWHTWRMQWCVHWPVQTDIVCTQRDLLRHARERWRRRRLFSSLMRWLDILIGSSVTQRLEWVRDTGVGPSFNGAHTMATIFAGDLDPIVRVACSPLLTFDGAAQKSVTFELQQKSPKRTALILGPTLTTTSKPTAILGNTTAARVSMMKSCNKPKAILGSTGSSFKTSKSLQPNGKTSPIHRFRRSRAVSHV